MNFIYISPNFPTNYWHFCDMLAQNGVNVLGIGDCPYDQLQHELKMALTEYYRVGSIENYDEMYKAVAYFAFKYGPIDWLESNNEHWLKRDAELRTAFHITTGFADDERMARSPLHPDGHPHIMEVLKKSEMKRYYALAGVPACRFVVSTEGLDDALDFAEKVGFPLFCRPNIRTGSQLPVVEIADEAALAEFFEHLLPEDEYIIEPYVTGDIWTYDAVIDSEGQPLFESNCVYPPIADIVTGGLDSTHYIPQEMNPELRDAGRRVVRAYGIRSRFVHLEFFRLSFDHPELGQKDDFVGLEVNMRPGGGYMADMINYARNIDIYKIWADMICGKTAAVEETPAAEAAPAVKENEAEATARSKYFTMFIGRRDGTDYVHPHNEVLDQFGKQMCMTARVPDALSDALGNNAYIARFETKEEMDAYAEFVTERQ